MAGSSPAMNELAKRSPLDRWASSAHQTRQQHHDEDDQEDEKQYLRDTCRSDCDPTKTKEAGDYRDY
jgi:hypothetical protein